MTGRPCLLCGSEGYDAVAGPADRPYERCRACGLLSLAVPFEPSGAPAIRPLVVKGRLSLHRRLLEKLGSASAPGRLLDVGSGSGEFLELASAAGWEVEGVEPYAPSVDKARRKGLTVHAGDLAAARLPEGSFDVVTYWEVIDYVEEPVAELREVLRVLRPGGVVWLRTRNAPFHMACWNLMITILITSIYSFTHQKFTIFFQ